MSPFVDFKALKERVSIEDVLRSYGLLEELKRSNDTLSGRCPIHKGTSTTSFKVSLSRNIWNCFGPCQGGNILDLVAQLEHVEIREAALLIAERFNVQPASRARARAAQAVSEPAAAAPEARSNPPLRFERLQHLDPSHAAVRRLGFTPATIEHFEVGYCSRGLMRGRIAIPIHNAEGELVAYAGKATRAKQHERFKYPEGFRKELEVYNLQRAARSKRLLGERGLIVTSGFLDAFRIHEAGFDNVVALLGFTPSREQLTALERAFAGRPKATVIVKRNPAIAELLSRLCPLFFVRLVALDRHPGDLSTGDIQQALS